jgi:very-short-patch-repair endonuclease
MTPSALLVALAEKQFGVIAHLQLLALGFTEGEIRGHIRRGLLHRIHPGVYAVGHRRLAPTGKLLAAQLSCGPTAFLSHRTAAALWGLRKLDTRRIHVTVPGPNIPIRPGLKVHRTRRALKAEDLARRDGLCFSSVAQLLIELAPEEKSGELDRLITQAVRKRVLNVTAVEQVLSANRRRPGCAKLGRAFRGYRPHADHKSGLERAFAELIRGTDVPEPLRNVTVDGWELDFYWPEHKLAVELDGRSYHVAVKDLEKDKYKDAKLLLLGIHVLRITEFRLEVEPQPVLSDVLALTTEGASPAG